MLQMRKVILVSVALCQELSYPTELMSTSLLLSLLS